MKPKLFYRWSVATLGIVINILNTTVVKAQPSIIPAADGTGTAIVSDGHESRVIGGKISQDKTNLFHSFQQFGLNEGQIVNFISNPEIRNIISRVVGGSPSLINGLIQVTGGNSNLFFINPSGIFLGPNSSLNVPASFTATTASNIGFDSGLFNSIGTNDYSRLLGNPSLFYFKSSQVGSIVNVGNLAVSPGKSINLIGGTIINRGSLEAPQGNIILATVSGGNAVRISQLGHLLSLEISTIDRNFLAQYEPLPVPLSIPQLLTGTGSRSATGIEINSQGELVLINSEVRVKNGDVVLANSILNTQNAKLSATRNITLVESQLLTQGNLDLLAANTVRIRDGNSYFSTVSGSNITIQGNQNIDILALNSRVAFQAAGDITLLSNGNISGDTHFRAGGNVSILSLDGGGGTLVSLYDPIISSEGDVRFGDYTGTSLKVEARGSIQGGDISITGPDTTLSNVTDPDGVLLSSSPALILRSGISNLANTPNVPPTLTTGDTFFGSLGTALGNSITVGSISTAGGPVILESAGEIVVDAIATFSGNIALKAASNIAVTGTLQSAGGNIDLSAGNLLTVSGTFADSSGVDVSISSANGTSGGAISIRHAGSTSTPFIVGDATTNGTAGVITSSSEITLPQLSVPVPPSTYTQSNITIITPVPSPTPESIPSLISEVTPFPTPSPISEANAFPTSSPTPESTSSPTPSPTLESILSPTPELISSPTPESRPFSIPELILFSTPELPPFLTPTPSLTPIQQATPLPIATVIPNPPEAIAPIPSPLQQATPLPIATVIPNSPEAIAPIPLPLQQATPSPTAIVIPNSPEAIAPIPSPLQQATPFPTAIVIPNSPEAIAPTLSPMPTSTLSPSSRNDSISIVNASIQSAKVNSDTAISDSRSLLEHKINLANTILNPVSLDYIARLLDNKDVPIATLFIDILFSEKLESYINQDIRRDLNSFTAIQKRIEDIYRETGKKPAILYLLSRPETLDLVLVPPTGVPVYKSISAAYRQQLLSVVSDLRSEITNPRKRKTTSYLPAAQQLYQWTIEPLEADLQSLGIDTLVFAMDVGLRSLPIAALHDGKQFLVEKYQLGIIPSLNLTDTNYESLRDAEVLAMGAETFPGTELYELPAVPLELSTIRQQWQGESILNENFTLNNLRSKRSERPFRIVHLATHGEFKPGAPSNSFIQLSDRKLLLDELRELKWNKPPVELLVLSACKTALGDEEAELGFAGLAVQAGVKSALASLWYVSDEGTLAFMAQFYHFLRTAPIKVEALRQTQIAMLKGQAFMKDGRLVFSNLGREVVLPTQLAMIPDQTFSHPYYWATFTMIGSPW